ncbi:hypothetical protein LCM4573_25415 [Rhizobium sp. LCM 4573]|nr:hypothetical protein LCM4573_25415 [Rhizobium sp. LCM 4573]
MRVTIFANGCFEIDVGAGLRGQPTIEGRSRLTARFTNLICFERTFNNIGDRPVFTAGKPMCKVACLRAADGKLWLGHICLLLEKIMQGLRHQDGT